MADGAGELDSEDNEYVISRQGEFAVASPHASVSDCQICEGRGFVIGVEDGYEVSLTCQCRSVLNRVRQYNDACLPADYGEKQLDGLEIYPSSNLGKVRKQLKVYLTKPDPLAQKGYLLFGPPGVGKTHILCSVVRDLTLDRGIACKYVDFFHLSERIRSCLGDRNDKRPEDILEPLVEVPILAIDEMGKGMCTPFEIHIIDQLITRRYNANRRVLITTNYWPAKMMEETEELNVKPGRHLKRIGESLEERTDERIVSRLYEMCEMIEVRGNDFRYGSNA
mgnify:CR=1 FL=1